jgi:hypothetical protein
MSAKPIEIMGTKLDKGGHLELDHYRLTMQVRLVRGSELVKLSKLSREIKIRENGIREKVLEPTQFAIY